MRQGGLSLLEASQYNSEEEIRRRATYLLEHHLLSYSSYCSVKTFVQFILLVELVLIQNLNNDLYDLLCCRWTTPQTPETTGRVHIHSVTKHCYHDNTLENTGLPVYFLQSV